MPLFSVLTLCIIESSVLICNSLTLFQASAGGYMVAFAGRKYAARSLPVFVSNSSYSVTAFTLVSPETVVSWILNHILKTLTTDDHLLN
jgi:hypothetical protein